MQREELTVQDFFAGAQRTRSKSALKQNNDPFSQNADGRLTTKWWMDEDEVGMNVKTDNK